MNYETLIQNKVQTVNFAVAMLRLTGFAISKVAPSSFYIKIDLTKDYPNSLRSPFSSNAVYAEQIAHDTVNFLFKSNSRNVTFRINSCEVDSNLFKVVILNPEKIIHAAQLEALKMRIRAVSWEQYPDRPAYGIFINNLRNSILVRLHKFRCVQKNTTFVRFYTQGFYITVFSDRVKID